MFIQVLEPQVDVNLRKVVVYTSRRKDHAFFLNILLLVRFP